jgi:hypothetical protein
VLANASGIRELFFVSARRRNRHAGRVRYPELHILKLRIEIRLGKSIAMHRLALLAASSILLVGCASHSAAKAERRANETEAREAAQKWLTFLDKGDYAEAFEWEAQDFRIYRTQNQFVRYMQARRAPFGRTLSRSVVGAANIKKFAGVPEGDYESIIFKTAFEKKSPTAERVILVRQAVGWRVIDYRIY